MVDTIASKNAYDTFPFGRGYAATTSSASASTYTEKCRPTAEMACCEGYRCTNRRRWSCGCALPMRNVRYVALILGL